MIGFRVKFSGVAVAQYTYNRGAVLTHSNSFQNTGPKLIETASVTVILHTLGLEVAVTGTAKKPYILA